MLRGEYVKGEAERRGKREWEVSPPEEAQIQLDINIVAIGARKKKSNRKNEQKIGDGKKIYWFRFRAFSLYARAGVCAFFLTVCLHSTRIVVENWWKIVFPLIAVNVCEVENCSEKVVCR